MRFIHATWMIELQFIWKMFLWNVLVTWWNMDTIWNFGNTEHQTRQRLDKYLFKTKFPEIKNNNNKRQTKCRPVMNVKYLFVHVYFRGWIRWYYISGAVFGSFLFFVGLSIPFFSLFFCPSFRCRKYHTIITRIYSRTFLHAKAHECISLRWGKKLWLIATGYKTVKPSSKRSIIGLVSANSFFFPSFSSAHAYRVFFYCLRKLIDVSIWGSRQINIALA